MEKRAEESGRRSTRISTDTGQAGSWSSTPATNPQTEKVLDKDINNKSQSNGYTAVSWDEKEHPNNGDSSLGGMSTDPGTVSRPLSEKSTGPILILPGVNNNKFTDENASTRGLFHAAGALPMKSDLSLAHSRYRPSSAAGSGTGRSEMMSDTGSTVGGDKDYFAYTNMGPDTASTRAVMGARGVISPMAGDGRRSTDTLSVLSATGRDSMSHRPEMPDKEVYKTAE
ncbi:Alpha/beta hydrolase fold-3 [Penicillium cf. griseofulvum]|nr:Alpha/beta hydrolase fold-3 [Penicillium cf. griseofulvum]